MTKYEEQYYHDINRIADALEKLVQISTINREDVKEEPSCVSTVKLHYVCPYCNSRNIQSMYEINNVAANNRKAHYICRDCHKEFDIDEKSTNEMFINGERII